MAAQALGRTLRRQLPYVKHALPFRVSNLIAGKLAMGARDRAKSSATVEEVVHYSQGLIASELLAAHFQPND